MNMKTNKTQDMKKVLLPLFAAAMLFAACENEQDVAPVLTYQEGITFTVPDFKNGDDTRMAVDVNASGATFTWMEGDTLGVFPSNGYQTAFPISGGAGTNTAVFDGADWALRPNASYAAYYPFVYEIKDKTTIEASYLGQTQDGNGSTAHIGAFDYLAAKYNTVSADGNVNFVLNHLGCLVRFQLTMPEADTYTSMTLRCEECMFTTVGKFDLTATTPELSTKSQYVSISLALNNIATTEANQVMTLYMMLPPMDLSSKNLSIKVSGEKDYESIIIGKDMKAGNIYGYSNKLTTSHEYVDLGLSVMWATCNVGANSPEEYGDYFAWGETKPYYTEGHAQDNPCNDWREGKSGYNYSSYKWCNNDEWTGITKYTFADGLTNGIWYSGDIFIGDYKTVLDPEDDAATANWGGFWRIPTREEQDELRNNCTWTWTTKNGVNGYNVEGSNGNSIFLPAAGDRCDLALGNIGIAGSYWSSTLGADYSESAPSLHLDSNIYCRGGNGRCGGLTVRPVFTRQVIISTSVSLNKTTLNLTAGDPAEQLHATVLPVDATQKSIIWTSSNPEVATVDQKGVVTPIKNGSSTISATTVDGSNLTTSCIVNIGNYHNGHEYVDLGLSVKWATCNVGATSPEEYGDFFAWGELLTKEFYNEINYKFYESKGYYSKYYDRSQALGNFGDKKKILEKGDDVAFVKWGDGWRMPSADEFSELIQECSWTWDSYNNVVGYTITGKNGNTIFLPASGNSEMYNVGTMYWSRSRSINDGNAYCLYFTSLEFLLNVKNRIIGCSVRPICP